MASAAGFKAANPSMGPISRSIRLLTTKVPKGDELLSSAPGPQLFMAPNGPRHVGQDGRDKGRAGIRNTMEKEIIAAGTASHDYRYRLLVESVTDYAIYLLDTRGMVSSWNPGARRFKGYEAHEIIGKHFSEFYTEEDRATGLPQRALREAETKGTFENEGWRVRKDGTRFWALVVIDPVRDDTGALVGFAKVTRDLTERREAEETLRQSEERFKLLVQGVVDYAIYMLDADGIVTNWNAGAEHIKGYAADEIVGKHFSIFYSEEDRLAGAPQKALATAAREGGFETEAYRVRKDGSRFLANVVIDPIRNEAGSVIGFAKVTRDITQRRAAQEALDRAQENLVQSQKIEALGRLTGGIAHDFNNLLMAVLGSLELLKKRLPEGDSKSFRLLDNAVAGAKRGAALTQRMLAFARKQELKPEAISIPKLVEDMRELLEQALGPRIDLITRLAKDLPNVLADGNQLEAALLNLTVNARDAMPAGGSVTITAEADGSEVVLRVSDTGVGMDADTLKRATEPFFSTKGAKGTGLGLSMVHGLMAQHKGMLNIRSRIGRGTDVELLLPATDGYPIATSETETDAANTSNERKRILIVDDDALVRESTVNMLEDLGHEVTEASSGSEAEEHLRGQEWDLLITDYAMPKMTGLELAAIVKQSWPALPVLLVTGFAEIDEAEMDAHRRLPKPFDQAALASAIAALIG